MQRPLRHREQLCWNPPQLNETAVGSAPGQGSRTQATSLRKGCFSLRTLGGILPSAKSIHAVTWMGRQLRGVHADAVETSERQRNRETKRNREGRETEWSPAPAFRGTGQGHGTATADMASVDHRVTGVPEKRDESDRGASFDPRNAGLFFSQKTI